MEKKYESLTLFEFQEKFPDNDSCQEYLAEMKWPDGFKCERCGHSRYCSGKLRHTRQCTKCKYQSTPTSGTLFHKVKFPLLKAFYIVYYMSTNKKGIASTELSRKLGLRQKTCWLFQQKVMKTMASSGKHPLMDKVEVDETVVGEQEEGVVGRQNNRERQRSEPDVLLQFGEIGGSPVLGINGNVVIGHGVSNEVAIKNMIILAYRMAESNIYLKIKQTYTD